MMTNLLTRLHKYARSQDENFTTEAFAHLLEYLIDSDPEIAHSLFKKITKESFDLSKYPNGKVKISTQNQTKQGITDIQISAPDFIIVFENKIEAAVGYRQLERYTEFLLEQEGKQNLLILLSKYPIDSIGPEKSVLFIRWIQMSEFLNQELQKDTIHLTTRYLLQQFLDFLRHKGLSITNTTSPLSQSINSYLLTSPKQNIFYERIRNSNRLKEISELEELYNLMELLKNAVGNVRPSTKIKFDSGKNSRKGSPWIGFNFDRMDSFAAIYLDSPNEIIFETYNRKIDIQKLEQDGIGNIFWEEKWNWKKWELSLNLETSNFHQKSSSEQLGVLEEFVKQCYTVLGEE